MKTSKQTILLFVISFALCLTLQAQHTEIEHNSTGIDPQLLLTETTSGFGRLTMKNAEKGEWTLAARNGPGTTDDDFNIYFDDLGGNAGNIINIDGDSRKTTFESDVKINNHLTEPIMTFDVEGKNSAYINFEANGGSGIGGYFRYFAQQGGTAIPSYFELSAPGGDNYLTMFGGSSSTFGPGALGSGSGGGGRLRVVHNSSSTSPTMRLIEQGSSDFVRLFFTNQDVSANRFTIAARPGSSSPRMDLGYNGFSILTVHGDDINASESDGRVGINNTNPQYALELPNNALNRVGQIRSFDHDTWSDGRVKANITTIENGLSYVMQLNPVRYDHHSSEFGEKGLILREDYSHELGFIAQEIYEILPEAAYKPENENEDLWSVSYERIIPVLTKAIQEQQSIIKTQKSDLAELKDEMASLKALINTMASNN